MIVKMGKARCQPARFRHAIRVREGKNAPACDGRRRIARGAGALVGGEHQPCPPRNRATHHGAAAGAEIVAHHDLVPAARHRLRREGREAAIQPGKITEVWDDDADVDHDRHAAAARPRHWRSRPVVG